MVRDLNSRNRLRAGLPGLPASGADMTLPAAAVLGKDGGEGDGGLAELLPAQSRDYLRLQAALLPRPVAVGRRLHAGTSSTRELRPRRNVRSCDTKNHRAFKILQLIHQRLLRGTKMNIRSPAGFNCKETGKGNRAARHPES